MNNTNRILSFLTCLILLGLFFYKVCVGTIYAATSPDFNSDGKVDIYDFNILIEGFGTSYTILDFDKVVEYFGKPYAPYDPNHINTGVIYFSGSTGETSGQRNEIEGLIAFPEFKHAQPYFTIVRSDTTIDVHEDSQAVMDQEILLASTAGLDYFAFLGNGYGLKNYLSSPNKNMMKFAFMGGANVVINPSVFDKIVEWTTDPQYLTVTKSANPLIYIYNPQEYLSGITRSQAITEFNAFITRYKRVTGKTPILVAVQNKMDYSQLVDLGFTDISTYLITVPGNGDNYQTLAQNARTTWDSKLNMAKPVGLGIIPTAAIGFDPRPKGINPLFHDFGANPNWAIQGTPTEIANHVKEAMDWVKAHPQDTLTKTILIYAWNEFAEGGWLTPTLAGNDKNQRLNQISKLLGGTTMSTPVSPYAENPPPAHPQGIITITNPVADSIVSSTNFVVEGTAPNAARITIKYGGQTIFFINGKTGSMPNRPFSIKLPDAPTGIRALYLTSPDTAPRTIPRVTAR